MGNVEVKSNASNVLRKVHEAMEKAAKMIGGTVESHAKEYCPVDTGLLRNSITYALDGMPANTAGYTDNSGNGAGSYEGTMPQSSGDDQVTVYVGTNVYYAPYQELGAPAINLPAQPYLRPAFENHTDEIKQIIKMNMQSLN